MLVVPNVGELRLLEVLRQQWNAAEGLLLHLYQNNVTPSPGDTVATYVEATYDGYAAIPLALWPAPTTVGGMAYVAMGPQVFTDTGAVTPNAIYGYYVTSAITGDVVWAERFAGAPIAMDGPGKTITVTPSFTLASQA